MVCVLNWQELPEKKGRRIRVMHPFDFASEDRSVAFQWLIACLSGCFPYLRATARMSPIGGIKLGVSRCRNRSCNAQQRAERVERIEAPVKPKRKFIEVRL